MARRRTRTRTRYRTRVKRVYSRSKGGFKQPIDGILAGVGAGLGQKYLGNWGTGAAYLGVGMWRNNTTLKTLGGVALGRQISGMIPFIGGNGGGNGGGVFEG